MKNSISLFPRLPPLLCNPGSAHKGFLGGYLCRLTLQRTILTPTKFYTPTYIHTSFIYMMYIVLGKYLIILQLQKIIFHYLPQMFFDFCFLWQNFLANICFSNIGPQICQSKKKPQNMFRNILMNNMLGISIFWKNWCYCWK